MSLPVSFAAPIFSALSPSNGLVVGVNDNGQLDVITSVPNQLPAVRLDFCILSDELTNYGLEFMVNSSTSRELGHLI